MIPCIPAPNGISPFAYLFYHNVHRTVSWNLYLSQIQPLGRLKVWDEAKRWLEEAETTSQLVMATTAVYLRVQKTWGFCHWRCCDISLLTQGLAMQTKSHWLVILMPVRKINKTDYPTSKKKEKPLNVSHLIYPDSSL